MGAIKRERKKYEENKKYREYETSLIHAMYDSGYRISEIAYQLDIPVRTVYNRLGLISSK